MWSPAEVAFVVGTHPGDLHYCRALLASLRHFHPGHRIIVLADGAVARHELPRWATVRVVHADQLSADLGLDLRHYLAKLHLFFWDEYRYYAYFDADSVLISSLFDSPLLGEPADLYALDGRRFDLDDAEQRHWFTHSYVDLDAVQRSIDPTFEPDRPIGMLAGNFVVRAGAIPTARLVEHLEHTARQWEPGKAFHRNEQSLLNYVVNGLHARGELTVRLDRQILIPRDGSSEPFPGITPGSVARREPQEQLVLHWTAPSRRPRLAEHELGEVLVAFEDRYYADEAPWKRPWHRATRGWRGLRKRVRGRWTVMRRRTRRS